jgi:signal transduction histidine kinase
MDAHRTAGTTDHAGDDAPGAAAPCRTGPPDKDALDRLTRTACRLVRAPASLVFLVRRDGEGGGGVTDAPEPPTAGLGSSPTRAFCRHVVATGEPLAIGDSRGLALASGDPGVEASGAAAFLGVPLALADGRVIGALCVLDGQPRAWTMEETDALRDLARIAAGELALRLGISGGPAAPPGAVAGGSAAAVELARAERLEALAKLSGSIAHDMNNVLQAAGSGIRLAAKRLEGQPAAARGLLAAATEALDRGASMTRRLLGLAGRGVLFPQPVGTAALLARLAVPPPCGPAVEVRVEAPDGLPPAFADRGQLEEALRALVRNACEAVAARAGHGTLRLTASVEVVAGDAGGGGSHPAGLRPGAYVRLDVADDGAGMDADTLARAEEPFFTTRDGGRRPGLGLATAAAFARQSGGGIGVASDPAHGTTATLWLPSVVGATALPDAGAARRRAGAGPGTAPMPAAARHILLVDDDPLVRRMMAAQLEEAGHVVVTASGGADSLDLLRSGLAVDLLVSDLSMPGMGGVDLIVAAQSLRHGLPAILITGHPEGAPLDTPAGGPTGAAFVLMHKPVSGTHLADRIDAVLADGPPRRA